MGSCPPAPATTKLNSEAHTEPTINIGNLSCSGGSIVINLSFELQTDDGVEHRNVLKSNYYLFTGFVILSIKLCIIRIF